MSAVERPEILWRSARVNAAMATSEDNQRDLVDDYAPDPWLRQVFPVVAPLSDIKLGPQDVRLPADLHAKLVKQEDDHQAWRHRRDLDAAELVRAQRLASTLRTRAEAAERAATKAEARAMDGDTAIDWALADRQHWCEGSVEEYKSRRREVQVRALEEETEARNKVVDVRTLLAAERVHTASVEKALQVERTRLEEARATVEDVASESRRRVDEWKAQVDRAAADNEARVVAAEKAAEKRVADAEARAEEILKLHREQLEAAKASAQRMAVSYEKQRALNAIEVERRRESANQRLASERIAAETLRGRQEAECEKRLLQVLQREEDTRASCEQWSQGAVATLFETAAANSMAAHRREELAKQSLEQTVQVLHGHYSTQRHYNAGADYRMKRVLEGCLHNADVAPYRR